MLGAATMLGCHSQVAKAANKDILLGCCHSPGFYNFTGSNLSNYFNTIGTRNTKVAVFGDSTSAGAGAGSSGAFNLIGAKINSWPSQLAALINTASVSSAFGDDAVNAEGGTLPTYDPRIALTGTWTFNSSVALGGSLLRTVVSGSTVSFTPTNNIDTFILSYAQFSGAGTFTYSVNGGATTPVNCNGASAQPTITIPTTLGANTLTIAATSSSQIDISSFIAYNSAFKEISIYNTGYCGATSSVLSTTTNPWSPLTSLKSLSPDLTLMEGGVINDWGSSGVSLAVSMSNFQAMITGAKLSGNVILISGNPSNVSDAAYATQQGYVQQMLALAYANNIPFIDIWSLFGGNWTTPNANGWMYDIVHPNALGYTQIANYIYKALRPGFLSA